MPEPDTQAPAAPFYVGYLPLPAAVRRFLLPWLVANGVLLLAVAAVIAQQQNDPGDGTWDTVTPVTYEGVLTLDPYPLLHTTRDDSDATLTVLPIEQGKRGSQERLKDMHGRRVRLTGFAIERTGRVVLGLMPGDEGIEDLNEAAQDETLPEPQPLGEHTLVGEIVDPQCFMGAMKPGEGKPHKVCATLCITGGIPPVFVVRDAAGNLTTYLLMTADGGALPSTHYEYIADAIELRGRVERRGDMLVLLADLSSFRRLD